jgi:hypothetical protein
MNRHTYMGDRAEDKEHAAMRLFAIAIGVFYVLIPIVIYLAEHRH